MRGIIAGIVSTITWGTVFVFGQIAVRKGTHPVFLSFIRFLSASIFLFICLFLKKIKLKIERRDILSFIILGFTGIFGMNIFIFYSVKFTTSTSASVLMNANTFFIGIFAYCLFIFERESKNK